ncbi:TIGR03905 family TSCPD domain-containing protein [Deltaproteobacteria bacterium OttesenSCG-928-K17]|nr:TIGR03905 family TSCPD domain-containing protein [Deltaproteobacteria bacterium OttesenSCG-928-K17]
MRHSFKTRGVCSKSIDFEINDGLVANIEFEGGCPGNLRGVAVLAEGRPVKELVRLLSGIRCGDKKTSCPDQLSKALKKAEKK